MPGPDPGALGRPLPEPLLDPLRLLLEDPNPNRFPWLWLLLAIGLVVLLVHRFRARRRAVVAEAPAPTAGATALEAPSVLDALRGRVAAHGRVREGCHQLSALVREEGEAATGRELTGRTVREIRATLGDHAIPAVLDRVADLQFGREEPAVEAFEEVADLAGAALRTVGGPGTGGEAGK